MWICTISYSGKLTLEGPEGNSTMVCLYCWYDEMDIVCVEGGGGQFNARGRISMVILSHGNWSSYHAYIVMQNTSYHSRVR